MSQCRMKRRAWRCICSPLGRSLLPGLKSPKQSLSPPKSLDPLPADLLSSSFTVKLLSLSLCNSFYRAPVVHVCAQRCSSMARASDPASLLPSFKLSSPWLALTPHAGIHPPPPTLGETLPWIGCCAVESRPLMGSGGESESEGGGRRIQLKKNDITCAARERNRERERESEGGEWEVA